MARLDLPGQHGRWRRWRLLPQRPPSVVVDVSGVSDFDDLHRRPQPHSGPPLGQGERGTRSRPLTPWGPLATSRYVFCIRILYS